MAMLLVLNGVCEGRALTKVTRQDGISRLLKNSPYSRVLSRAQPQTGHLWPFCEGLLRATPVADSTRRASAASTAFFNTLLGNHPGLKPVYKHFGIARLKWSTMNHGCYSFAPAFFNNSDILESFFVRARASGVWPFLFLIFKSAFASISNFMISF
ncbi:MAG: hypothetical protein LDLANPLL_00938 [Turneriella sp.]|nr:hypothetical protein [Turneriella sp.]